MASRAPDLGGWFVEAGQGFPGAEVDNARDDSWRRCFTMLSLLDC
jgi:hypothetical protein